MDFNLRPFKVSDYKRLAELANNRLISKNLTDKFPYPYTEDHARDFIEFVSTFNPNAVFAITSNDEIIGGIGLEIQEDVYRKNMELGYWLGEPYWGKGIAAKAILKIVEYGFETFDISRIFARPYGSNLASQRVLEKAGFELEARMKATFYKAGEYEDELIFAVRR